ncbi:glycosyltransferase family 2 protein [uncultured Selenomonas sp.]|uniref:glycosyltransferase family 2 protein n=1 Tax=uncultured Selenomonas sp. TaxID=159275 RepID=UPI0025EBBC84|nr:glycosyltransferase family 2 protein [uncultured Selenomonas sp.]
MPVYNAEKYLTACVESIYAQTFRDYELLLVDDGSTDGSGRLADELAARDARARVIHLEKNGGVGPARNRGMRESIGRYIAFVDSDDWVLENYLSSMVEAAETYQADVVSTGLKYCEQQADASWKVKVSNIVVRDVTFLTEDKRRRLEFMTKSLVPIVAWAKLIRRDVMTRSNLHFEAVQAEDLLFFLHLLYASRRYVLIPVASYCYRQTPKSITRGSTLEKSRRAMQSTLRELAFVERDLKEMPELHESPELVQQIREWFAYALLENLWRPVSEGLEEADALAEARSVFTELAPEQAGILGYLLKAWIHQGRQ